MATQAFIALLLAYSLAFLRLARVIQPSYKYFPAWAQICLPVLVAAVGVFSDSLGDDKNKLDVLESVLMALGAGLAAWKGKAAAPLVVLVLVSLSLTACNRPMPETAARDAYRTAVKACQLYELAPAEYHNAERDRECRSLRLVCE